MLVGAKYAHQQRLAREFGATEALPSDQLARAVRRHSHSLSFGGAAGETATLSGGADVVIDCVGSAESISQSLAMVRPRGTVALVGMPGKVTIDLAPLWHREVRLAGAYAYGTETGAAAPGGGGCCRRQAQRKKSRSQTARSEPRSPWPSRWWPPSQPVAWSPPRTHWTRFEEAVAHAGAAGRRGAVKIAFDITKGHTR